CSHDRHCVVVCESSKQIGQTKGSGCSGCCSARLVLLLDLEVLLLAGGTKSIPVDLREVRRSPVDTEEREADWEEAPERMGACVCVWEAGGSEGEIPAEVVTEDA